MYTDFFKNIYNYFLKIYESFTQKKKKTLNHKCEEYGDEEYLYFNQEDRDLMYLNHSIER